MSEQQIEILSLRQMYETIFDEKQRADEQIDEFRRNEQRIKEQFEQLQIEFNEKSNKQRLVTSVESQTVGETKTLHPSHHQNL